MLRYIDKYDNGFELHISYMDVYTAIYDTKALAKVLPALGQKPQLIMKIIKHTPTITVNENSVIIKYSICLVKMTDIILYLYKTADCIIDKFSAMTITTDFMKRCKVLQKLQLNTLWTVIGFIKIPNLDSYYEGHALCFLFRKLNTKHIINTHIVDNVKLLLPVVDLYNRDRYTITPLMYIENLIQHCNEYIPSANIAPLIEVRELLQ